MTICSSGFFVSFFLNTKSPNALDNAKLPVRTEWENNNKILNRNLELQASYILILQKLLHLSNSIYIYIYIYIYI